VARPKSKNELLEQAQVNFDKLWKLIDSMSAQALKTDFDFSNDAKKKELHWSRDKNLRDVLIHLYEWHQLLITWIKANVSGTSASFLPKPYTWKTYGELNMEFWNKHQHTELQDAKDLLLKSHEESLAIVRAFSDEALFTKKYFNWTGSTSLGSYCISSMPSHYDWAVKKLRAHCKKLTTKP